MRLKFIVTQHQDSDVFFVTLFINKMPHGDYIAWYSDQKLHKFAQNKHGKRHGKYISFYKGGQIKFIYSLRDGKMHGEARSFSVSGYPTYIKNFKNDEQNGVQVYYDYLSEPEYFYYHQGQNISKEIEKHGYEINNITEQELAYVLLSM